MKVRGVRGAITVNENTSQEILSATKVLLKQMMDDNHLVPDDVASIFFSVTSDLNAEFPAKAARDLGLIHVALLCMTEIDIPGSLKSCLRILIHANTDTPASEIRHLYLGGATVLRPDLTRA